MKLQWVIRFVQAANVKKLLSIIIFILLFAIPVDTWAEPTLLQHREICDNANQSIDKQTFTFQEGSLVIVTSGLSDCGTNITVSAPGMDFQEDVRESGCEPSGNIDVNLEIWSANNVAAGTYTITIQLAPVGFLRWTVSEWSGIDTSENYVIDVSSASAYSRAPSNLNAGAVTTTKNNTLLFVAARTDYEHDDPGDWVAGSNYTFLYNCSQNREPNQKLCSEYRIVNAGTYSGNFTLTDGDDGGWSVALIAYAASEREEKILSPPKNLRLIEN